jgi:hypothetical protein
VLALLLGHRLQNLVKYLWCRQTNVIAEIGNEVVASGKYLFKMIRFCQDDYSYHHHHHHHYHHHYHPRTIIFKHYSMATFIMSFFILRANEALISYIGMLPCGCSMLYYMFDAQLFLQPQHILHRKCGNWNVAHSHQGQFVYTGRSVRSLREWVKSPAFFRRPANDAARPASMEPYHRQPHASARSLAGVLRRR